MIYCPNCKTELNLETLTCEGQGCLSPLHGVARLMTKSFAQTFLPQEEMIVKTRRQDGRVWEDPLMFEKMPFLSREEGRGFPEWKSFCTDLELIFRLLKSRESLTILNYGSWNGWLSNQLVKHGHQVTAVSYFGDPYDGLGARQWYKNTWLSIQMDIENTLEILDVKYDCIIINRTISFLEDPAKICQELIDKLTEDGILIITGMNYYKKTDEVKRRKEAFFQGFIERYGFDLRFTQAQGYLDKQDIDSLNEIGIQVFPFPGKMLQNLRSRLRTSKPLYYYGVYEIPRYNRK